MSGDEQFLISCFSANYPRNWLWGGKQKLKDLFFLTPGGDGTPPEHCPRYCDVYSRKTFVFPRKKLRFATNYYILLHFAIKP